MEITLEKIREIFKNEVDAKVDVNNMNPDESIYEQGVDSLDSSSAFLALEEEFGVNFSSSDIDRIDTLNKIKDLIIEKKG